MVQLLGSQRVKEPIVKLFVLVGAFADEGIDEAEWDTVVVFEVKARLEPDVVPLFAVADGVVVPHPASINVLSPTITPMWLFRIIVIPPVKRLLCSRTKINDKGLHRRPIRRQGRLYIGHGRLR